MNKHLLAIMLLSLSILAIIFLFLLIGGRDSYNYVDVDGERIIVEIANTEKERQTGLMFRESLCDDCGMLFVFEQEGLYGFWMKNTLIPLDIIFIDADFDVVDIFHAVPCAGNVCDSYTPRQKALYVLEVNGNRFNETIIGKKVKIFYNQRPS
jgi:hypothetical protein